MNLAGNSSRVFIDVPAQKRIQIDTVFGIDENSNPYLIADSGDGQLTFNAFGSPELRGSNNKTLLTANSSNLLEIWSGIGSLIVTVDENSQPVILSTGTDGKLGFDADGNPNIVNKFGDQVFGVDDSTHRPTINGDVYPSTGGYGSLFNDTTGGLSWQSPYRSINNQTGTSYTLAISDKMVTFNNSSAITLIIPTHASVAFPPYTEIDLVQLGSGQVTVSAADGVTMNSYVNKTSIAGQYAGATLKMLNNDDWVLIGNLA